MLLENSESLFCNTSTDSFIHSTIILHLANVNYSPHNRNSQTLHLQKEICHLQVCIPTDNECYGTKKNIIHVPWKKYLEVSCLVKILGRNSVKVRFLWKPTSDKDKRGGATCTCIPWMRELCSQNLHTELLGCHSRKWSYDSESWCVCSTLWMLPFG